MIFRAILQMLIVFAVLLYGPLGCSESEPQSNSTADLSQKLAEIAAHLPEGTSLLGKQLLAPELEPHERTKRQAAYDQAREKFTDDPENELNIIWLGRRAAYLGQYGEAIRVFSDGLLSFPGSYRLLRHRGHRFITRRNFSTAIRDLSRAAELIEGVPDEIEPDGMPNEKNIPRSTTHTNIYYHLGLAYYLNGDFAQSADAYRKCLAFSKNDDMVCASAYWLYLSLRRSNDADGAPAVLEPIRGDMDIIENFAYHKLLLLYKGEMTASELGGSAAAESIDDATLGYGIAVWHLVNGEADQAMERFRRIVDGPAWPAFGHIAAEAELARVARPDDGSDS
ncbi:MAG: tetratricopeptide repeat protein [Planctomycetes bacterium]|nr:tetratricopeptide repeat protein [Planctomycetota bacterium]